MRIYRETHAISAMSSSTTQDTMVNVRTETLDRNDGKNVKRSAYVLGSGRQSCEPEFNFGIQAISAMASSTTGYDEKRPEMAHKSLQYLSLFASINYVK